MRGYIKKNNNKGDSSYTIVLSLGKDPDTGKYKQKWITVKGTKREAETKLAEIIHQKETGTYIEPGKITLGEFLDKWLKEYAWPNLAPRTAEGYESIVKVHLIPAMGKVLLAQLKPERIQKYQAEKLDHGRCDGKGGLSANTVRHHHITLHDAFESALKWGLVNRNPVDAVDSPRVQRAEMHTMNEDDLHLFLEAARSTPYYALFYLALYSGMRRSELLALRWLDLDLLYCQLSVTRSIHQLRDGSIVFRQPKTEKGRRLIALPPSAALLLKAHREEQIAQKMVLGTTLKEDDLVFCDVNGKPVIPDHVTQAWRRLARKVGLNHIRLQDARHTHASLMLKQGIHPKIVQERLGHASIQITLDTYSHVAPGLQEAAAALFDKGLAPREASVHENNISQEIK